MPGFDGTGPAGVGPMTGWGGGNCNPSGSHGSSYWWPRRGIGFGYGRGRGYRPKFRATGLPRWARGGAGWGGPYLESSYSREDEIRMLKSEAEALKDEPNVIERRMAER